MHISVVTLFPDMFDALGNSGITGRAMADGLVTLSMVDPRDFATDKHRSVDDRPYGGGPGMVLMFEPMCRAIEAARNRCRGETTVVGLSPQGESLRQGTVEALAKGGDFVLVCGRYEGFDERIAERCFDMELSIGDYVMSGGELAAMVIIDAVTRLQPGAVGHPDSVVEESFSAGLLDCPHFTRPEIVAGLEVPKVLLGGNHQAVARWRLKQSVGRTYLRRPDLWEQKIARCGEERHQLEALLAEFLAERVEQQ
jgi:tRNA (guanine37-N1)-methyltransferase